MFITKIRSLAGSIFVACALAWATEPAAAAQQVAGARAAGAVEEAAGEASTAAPLVTEYKGVRIGMSADEARSKLGGSDAVRNKQDVFLVSDDEMAQLSFDREGKLQTIAVTYMPKSGAPTATDVLGAEVPAGADGRVYKLVHYPEAGYWVSYSRTAGDSPIVIVTMKKMLLAQ